MKRKMCTYVLFLCCSGFIYHTLVPKQSKTKSNNEQSSHRFRAAIVTLTRGDSTRLLNMLHSIEYFYPQAISKYPVIIFYDPHGTTMQTSVIDHLISCVKLKLIFEKIVLFDLMRNPAVTIEKVNRETSSIHQRTMGYRLMCQFWSHTVFHHSVIKNNYDYIMRLDDDSYFLESFNYDLFQYAHDNHLDYIYRALAWDIPMSGPDDFLAKYLRAYHNNCQLDCFPFRSHDSIYNNFFLTRVNFWYQSKIDRFLNDLLVNDSILIHSLGDGNIHAVVLTLASDVKRSHQLQFAYAHNIHIYGKRNKNFDLEHQHQNWFQILSNHSHQACHQLIIIEPYSKQIQFLRIR